MQTVASCYEIESPGLAAFELNMDASIVFMNRSNAVPENDLDLVCDGVEDGFCHITAGNAKETIAEGVPKDRTVECTSRSAGLIHKFHAIDDVTEITQARNEVHPFANIKSNAPEIDHVTALAEIWSKLDQSRFISAL
jgi:hypothetical protein